MTEVNIDMDLAVVSIITLKVLVAFKLHSFWNIINNVLCWWYAALWHILVFVILASSVVWNLRNSSCILLGNSKCMCYSLWPIPLIIFLVLFTIGKMRNWSLTSALFNTIILILSSTAIELLYGIILLESPYVLCLFIFTYVSCWHTWCWPTLFIYIVWGSTVDTVFVWKTRWDL